MFVAGVSAVTHRQQLVRMAEAIELPRDRRQVQPTCREVGDDGGLLRNIILLSGASMDTSATSRAFLAPTRPSDRTAPV